MNADDIKIFESEVPLDVPEGGGAAIPGQQLTLTLQGISHTVMFRHRSTDPARPLGDYRSTDPARPLGDYRSTDPARPLGDYRSTDPARPLGDYRSTDPWVTTAKLMEI